MTYREFPLQNVKVVAGIQAENTCEFSSDLKQLNRLPTVGFSDSTESFNPVSSHGTAGNSESGRPNDTQLSQISSS